MVRAPDLNLGLLALWRTYMPTANLTEVRRALDRWSAHPDSILSGETGQPAKVVPIAAVRP